jgi:predicted amidohydrolase
MQDLRLTLVQANLFWEERPENLEHFSYLLGGISEQTDLVLLPETFNTGFSINPSTCAEPMNGPSMQFLKKKADEMNVVIMATLLISESDGCYNRLICMQPDGQYQTYDKRHLFRLSEEYRIFRGGNQKIIIKVKGWNISPIICYDLRFPVWSKNIWHDGQYNYDLLVCLANWPASRAHVWKTLLMARAMENQSYVAGVNRIGRDGHGTGHTGNTTAIDPKGNVLFAAPENKEAVHTVTLSAQELSLFRESFTVGMDWDHFSININH